MLCIHAHRPHGSLPEFLLFYKFYYGNIMLSMVTGGYYDDGKWEISVLHNVM